MGRCLMQTSESTLSDVRSTQISELARTSLSVGTAEAVLATCRHYTARNDDTAPLLQICCPPARLSSGKGDLHLHPPQRKTPEYPL